MYPVEFLELDLEERRCYIRQHGTELASCLTSFGELQNYVFYAVDDFFVEEIYDMNLQCLIEINIISEKEVYDKYVEKSLL